MEIYVGIDPSFDSTGLSLIIVNENTVEEKFYIIKPNKLTKKEKICQEALNNFEYIIYEKLKSDIYKIQEINKTKNFIQISNIIYNIILEKWKEKNSFAEIYVCMEGISYGSMKTKSVFDLAGLNYIIRKKILKLEKYTNMLNFEVHTPSEIKKFITGNGKASKSEICDKFKEFHPEIKLPKIDDLADSYFMAKYIKDININ